MKKRIVAMLFIFTLLFTCLGGRPPIAQAASPSPAKIQLNIQKKTLYTGEKLQISAKGPANVKWSSSNSSAAKVSKNGVVTAQSVKKTTNVKITAVSVANKKVKATAVITVKKGVQNKSITLNRTQHTLTAGQSVTLKVSKWNPSKTTIKKVTWKSSNDKIATVSSKGVVQTKKQGTVTITATNTYGKKASCKLIVKPKPAVTPTAAPTYMFAFRLADETGAPLPGVSCTLEKSKTQSTPSGDVRFEKLTVGNYTLSIDTPVEYEAVSHSVSVSQSGITIDGKTPASGYTIIAKLFQTDFSIPVRMYAGGEFGLYQNDALIQNASLATAGNQLEYWDIPAGTYTLKQSAIPTGQKPYDREHTVVVNRNGITVDGTVLHYFELAYENKSDKPTVNPVLIGQSIVSGTGIPGATIHVSMSAGINTAFVYTTSVQPDGTWITAVNPDIMQYGTPVTVRQEEPGFAESDAVRITVDTVRADVKLRAVDAETGLPVANMVFQIGEFEFNTATTDANGMIDYGISAGENVLLFIPGSASPYTHCEVDGKILKLDADGVVTIGGEPVSGVYDLKLLK